MRNKTLHLQNAKISQTTQEAVMSDCKTNNRKKPLRLALCTNYFASANLPTQTSFYVYSQLKLSDALH